MTSLIKKQISILVFDDEESIVEFIKMRLESGGFTVYTAFDGNEAVSLARKLSPNITILDIMLPGINGYEVCSQIKKSIKTSIYNLLKYLLVNNGLVLTKSTILEKIWGFDFSGDADIIEVYIRYLRDKIGDKKHNIIRNVRGAGYKVVVQ